MTEEKNMMAWLERRLTSSHVIPLHVQTFKDMWAKEFGTLDNIPSEFKKKVEDRYKELKRNVVE